MAHWFLSASLNKCWTTEVCKMTLIKDSIRSVVIKCNNYITLQEWCNYYRAVGQVSDFYIIYFTNFKCLLLKGAFCLSEHSEIILRRWSAAVMLQWWLTFRKLLPSAHTISAAQPQWPLSSWSRLLRLWPKWLSLVTQSALRRVQMSSISEWWRPPWS